MIDSHLHTNHSDGLDSVEELLKNAEKNNLEIISITDHDSVGAYHEMEKNPNLRSLFSGKIIPGVELKTHYKNVPIEVLGYGIDPNKIKIHKIDQELMQKDILNNFIPILEKEKLIFNKDELYIDRSNPAKQWAAFVTATELLSHPENQEKIEKIGTFDATSFYRAHQSNPKSIFYVDETKYSIEINDAIKRIHEAGGLAFLAHGWVYPYPDVPAVLEELAKTTKLDGFECMHSNYTKEQIEDIKALCRKYNKYMSGGSDYHAGNKPDIKMGTGKNNNIAPTLDLVGDWIDKVRQL